MYDYRTPLKKRGSAPARRSSSHATPRRQQAIAHSRRLHDASRRPASRSTSAVTSIATGSFSWLSWLIGFGLLSVVLIITYLVTFNIVLPNLVPVVKDEVLVLSPSFPLEPGQMITIVRLVPQSRRLVLIQGMLPNSGLNTELAAQLPLSWQLGAPVDRYVEIETPLHIDQPSTLTATFWNLVQNQKNNQVSIRDRVSWWLLARSAGQSQTTTHLIEKPTQWSQARRLLQADRENHQCSIAIINTTTQKGLATQLSSILEEAGQVVVKVADTRETGEQTKLLVDQASTECLPVAAHLTSFITLTGASDPALQAPILQDGLLNQYRAPIVVTIGSDLSTVLDQWSKIGQ